MSIDFSNYTIENPDSIEDSIFQNMSEEEFYLYSKRSRELGRLLIV